VKFYVDAEPRARAERRLAELTIRGARPSVAEIERELLERDRKDSTRSDSPLTRTQDAVLLDTTGLTPEQVVEKMLEVVRSRL